MSLQRSWGSSDRLVLTNRREPARISYPGAHLLSLTPNVSEDSPRNHSSLSRGAAPPAKEIVNAVTDWVDERADGLPELSRATLRAQVPFLVDWAMLRHSVSSQIENTLMGQLPTRITFDLDDGGDVTARYAKDYLQSRGTKFTTTPGTGARNAERSLLDPTTNGLRRVKRYAAGLLRKGQAGEANDLLAISLQRNSTRSLLPVLRGLREEGQDAVFLLLSEDGESQALATQANIPFRLIGPGLNPGLLGSSLRAARKAGRVFDAPAVSDLLIRLNLPKWVALKNESQSLGALLKTRFLRSHHDNARMQDALDQCQTAAVVFVTRRAAIDELLRGRARRTKRIFYLQGLVPDTPPIFTEMQVDAAFVGSGLDRNYAKRCGVSERRLRVTGYPDYDHFPKLSQESCRSQVDHEYESTGKRLIVFTSQYPTLAFPDWARMSNLRAVLEAGRAMPDCFFLIKPHPLKETIPNFLQSDLPGNVAIAPKFDTPTALKAADVALTYWSTTALEAMLLGTPLVQINATGLPDFLDFSTQLGRPIARDTSSLIEILKHTFAAGREAFLGDRERFLSEYQISTDGDATHRTVQALIDILRTARGTVAGQAPRHGSQYQRLWQHPRSQSRRVGSKPLPETRGTPLELLLSATTKKKRPLLRVQQGPFKINPATSYSPTEFPLQYHRLRQA